MEQGGAGPVDVAYAQHRKQLSDPPDALSREELQPGEEPVPQPEAQEARSSNHGQSERGEARDGEQEYRN